MRKEFKWNRKEYTMELHGGYRHKASKEIGFPVEQWLDFSANINPFGMPKGIKNAMLQGIEELVHYPDPDCLQLTKALAQWEGVEEERIFCGNGGADVLYRYLTALSPNKVCLPVPTFVEYEEVLKNHWNHQYEVTFFRKKAQETLAKKVDRIRPELVLYPMECVEQKENGQVVWKENHLVLTEEFLQCLDDTYDLLILCSPNNPTGKMISWELLENMIEKTREYQIKVLLDLSFLDFVGKQENELVKQLKKERHVTILRSFTKMYGIPGIRLGYGILDQTITKDMLQQKGPSWSVNHLAQKAGMAALLEEEFVKKTVAYIKKESAFLIEQLESLGFLVLCGEANYILFQKQGDDTLHERVKQRGILIRSCQNYRGLTKDYYRIGIKTREENEKLLQVFREEVK